MKHRHVKRTPADPAQSPDPQEARRAELEQMRLAHHPDWWKQWQAFRKEKTKRDGTVPSTSQTQAVSGGAVLVVETEPTDTADHRHVTFRFPDREPFALDVAVHESSAGVKVATLTLPGAQAPNTIVFQRKGVPHDTAGDRRAPGATGEGTGAKSAAGPGSLSGVPAATINNVNAR